MSTYDPDEKTVRMSAGADDDAVKFSYSAGTMVTTRRLPASDQPAETGDEEEVSYEGRYKILQPIGSGGMGEVYLAEQTEPLRRTVALKLIRGSGMNQDAVARFDVERQALALMEHPCIAKVFDAGLLEDGRPFFAMEFVNGEPITEFCDRRKLPARERLELFCMVCEAVQHAHHKAVLHRDLKPQNVLVTVAESRPVPKVIDFGVAKALALPLTERTHATQFGAVLGTPAYMSPEQAESGGVGVDTRTDVYALGVLLYELLVGALPFEPREGGFEAFRQRIVDEEPQRPSTRLTSLQDRDELALLRGSGPRRLHKELRGDLDWIVMKALEKDRTRRYGSPSEFATDILRYLNDEPVSASPPSPSYRFAKFVRRNRLLSATVAAAWLVVLLFAMVMAQQNQRVAREVLRVEEQRERAEEGERQAETAMSKSSQMLDFVELALNDLFTANWVENDPLQRIRDIESTLQRLRQDAERLFEPGSEELDRIVRLLDGLTDSRELEVQTALRAWRTAWEELDTRAIRRLDQSLEMGRLRLGRVRSGSVDVGVCAISFAGGDAFAECSGVRRIELGGGRIEETPFDRVRLVRNDRAEWVVQELR